MHTNDLTDAARSLLHRRLAGEWVGVTEENRPIYRERWPLASYTRSARLPWEGGELPSHRCRLRVKKCPQRE